MSRILDLRGIPEGSDLTIACHLNYDSDLQIKYIQVHVHVCTTMDGVKPYTCKTLRPCLAASAVFRSPSPASSVCPARHDPLAISF